MNEAVPSNFWRCIRGEILRAMRSRARRVWLMAYGSESISVMHQLAFLQRFQVKESVQKQ